VVAVVGDAGAAVRAGPGGAVAHVHARLVRQGTQLGCLRGSGGLAVCWHWSEVVWQDLGDSLLYSPTPVCFSYVWRSQ
jgi:hypothetical protein